MEKAPFLRKKYRTYAELHISGQIFASEVI